MTKSLKFINECVSSAKPSDYDSVSYNKYFRVLTTISNLIMEDVSASHEKEKSLINEINKLEDGRIKENLLKLVNQ